MHGTGRKRSNSKEGRGQEGKGGKKEKEIPDAGGYRSGGKGMGRLRTGKGKRIN